MKHSMVARRFALALLAAVGLGSSSCGSQDFDPPNAIRSVRVLATKADKPYAAPGETVELEMLAVDGRRAQAEPMRLFWIPAPCMNPTNDTYYNCFKELPAQIAAQGGLVLHPVPGVNVSNFLPTGPKFSFTMPSDAITSHPVVSGAGERYGMAVVFNIACAGHLEFIEPNTDSLQQPPIACFNTYGDRVGPEDFVFGFVRVYAYDRVRNANPMLGNILFEDKPVDLVQGLEISPCTEAKKRDCPKHKFHVEAPESAQETNELDKDADGNALREQVWLSYFTTYGQFDTDAKLLFDTRAGRISDNDNDLFAPNDVPLGRSVEGRVYLVLHDSRGGVNWLDIPLRVR